MGNEIGYLDDVGRVTSGIILVGPPDVTWTKSAFGVAWVCGVHVMRDVRFNLVQV